MEEVRDQPARAVDPVDPVIDERIARDHFAERRLEAAQLGVGERLERRFAVQQTAQHHACSFVSTQRATTKIAHAHAAISDVDAITL